MIKTERKNKLHNDLVFRPGSPGGRLIVEITDCNGKPLAARQIWASELKKMVAAATA